MIAVRPLARAEPETERDHIVHLHDVSWADYLRVLRMRGDHSAPRITYLEGELEIWFWRSGELEPYQLCGEHYRAIQRSKVLPGIDLDVLARFLDRSTASRAIRDYRAALARASRRNAR
jgi:hypothetical protein